MAPLPEDRLNPKDRRLARVSVSVVLGNWKELRELRLGAEPGEPDRAWREAILQTHLFAGFPRLVEALGVLEEAGGLGEFDPGENDIVPDQPDVGRGLFERIYGEQAAAVEGHLNARHPTFAAWILGHAYGRVLSREGLGADRRELLAVACLAAQGQSRQLFSHARGALRLGATGEELGALIEVLAGDLGPERADAARAVIAPLVSTDQRV